MTAPPNAAAVVLQAQAALLSQPHLQDAATALAVEMAQALQCSRVSVGLLDGKVLSVVASSGGHTPDPRLAAAAAVSAAMYEALDQSATLGFPPVDTTAPLITVAHQALGGAACTVLLPGGNGAQRGDGHSALGALTLERNANAFTADERRLCEDLAGFAGPVLALKQQAARPWWRRSPRADGSGGHGLRRVLGAVVLAAAVLAVTVPVPYRVSAPARLEGSVQRAIVAAADGFLQQANVRAGDTVKEGQVLAELASQDLQLERSRRESELAQHENAYRTAQARNDRAQMVISQSRAGEAQAMLALVQGQIERARIQAPFDGVVIKGDLSQTLGAPVQRGEVLLTIAPGDSFRLIVEVDESDIGAVRPGQGGELALAAVPERALHFTTRRVVPVAASAQARNYFEVEAALDGPWPGLRPGLSGVARIDAGERTVWWIATHRLANWLRLTFWSFGV